MSLRFKLFLDNVQVIRRLFESHHTVRSALPDMGDRRIPV
jgi:hypothetical protein